ncbi:O-antigen ligase family protein [Oxalobacteraceae bacterium CAVE-383]|nr:O-antigen ligase family protein [Oxalobacteraceae bacterium CAVE-383]
MYKNVTLGSAKVFFLLTLFFVSFSTALTNVFAGLLLIAFVLAVFGDRTLLRPMRLSPAVIALVLYGMIILAWSWSVAPQDEVFQGISKYRKLLFLPIAIALVWQDGRLARKGFIAFMAGAVFLTLGCYLVWAGLISAEKYDWWKAGTPDNAFAFKSYITIGILLGFAAGACWAYWIYAPTLRMKIAAAIGGILFAFPVLFLMNGRTGYVVVLCVSVGLGILRFRNDWKKLVIAMLILCAAFAAVFHQSGKLRMRAEGVMHEVSDYSKTNDLNSSGIRLTFYKAGLEMFLAHPFVGTGTGSFAENFMPTAHRVGVNDPEFYNARSQPHSEVVLMAVQLGIVGLALYFGLMATLGSVVRKQKTYQADLLFLLCISFAVPAFFNSLLWDITEGYWFVLLAGCLYAAARRPDAATIMQRPAST